MDDKLLTMQEACDLVNVSSGTLRRWEKAGNLTPAYTPGGHRRYTRDQLMGAAGFRKMAGKQRYAIAYCRVSTSEQKADLERQAQVVANYCEIHAYRYKVIRDVGSGLNYNKKGLQEIIRAVCNGEVSKIIVCDKDRLMRFGYEMMTAVCEANNTEIEIINISEDVSDEKEMVDDVLSIITVFSSRLYGKRSHRNKKIVEQNRRLFQEVSDEESDSEMCSDTVGQTE